MLRFYNQLKKSFLTQKNKLKWGRKMSKKIGLLALFIGLLLALVACGDASESSGDKKETLKMATSADYPPFESHDTNGDFIGFDIDLAHAVAEELGYELEITDMSFDGLIGSLQAGRVDMVLSGMSATEDRKDNVDFSTEYNRSGEMFISTKENEIQDMDELDGKTIGVQLGSIQEEGAEKIKDDYGFNVKKIDDAGMLIQELVTGRIDVAYLDKEVAQGYMKAQDLVGFNDPTRSSPGMAIAFPKGNDLVDKVNEVLEQFEEDGTLDALKEEWLTE